MTVSAFDVCDTKVLSSCACCDILRLAAAGKQLHVVARSYSSESTSLKRQFIPSHKRKWKKKKSQNTEEIKSTLIQVIDARAKQLACKIVKASTEDILLQLVPSNRNVSNNAFLVLPTSAKPFLDTSSKNTLPEEPQVLEGQSIHDVDQVRTADISFLHKDVDAPVFNMVGHDEVASWNSHLNSFKYQLEVLPVVSESRAAEQIVEDTDGKVFAFEDYSPYAKKFICHEDHLTPTKSLANVTEDVSSVEKSLSSEEEVLRVIFRKDLDRTIKSIKTDTKSTSSLNDQISVNTNILEKKPSLVKRHTFHSKERLSGLVNTGTEVCDTHPELSTADALIDSGAVVEEDISVGIGESDAVSTKSVVEATKSVVETKSSKAKTKTKVNKVAKVSKDEALPVSAKQTFRGNPEKQNRLFNQDLLSFVEACCFSNKQAHAHSVLKFHHLNKSPSAEHIIRDITIHNTLMHSWAKMGKLQHIKELFLMMKQGGLNPSLQSYAACLECLGRQRNFDVEMCQRVIHDITRDGFDVKDIFNVCMFRRDEQHFILKALKLANPNFVYHPIPDPEPYKGDLLEKLNSRLSQDQVIEGNPYAGIVSTSDLQKRAELQRQMELKGSVTVESIVKMSANCQKTTEYRDKVDSVKEEWKAMLVRAFEKMVHNVTRRSKDLHTHTLYPYLTLLPPLDMIECIMLEIEQISLASDSFSICMDQLCRRLGMRVHSKYMMQDKVRSKYAKKMTRLYEKFVSHYNDEEFQFINHRDCWQRLMKQAPEGASLDVAERPWSAHIVKVLGKKLYDIILNDVKIDSNMLKKKEKRRMVPAFYTIYRNYGHRVYQEIKPHPVIVKLFRIADVAELTFDTTDLPMIVPPVPWISKNHGGFLLGSAQLIRLPLQAQSQTDQLDRTPPSQIYSVLDSLNTLGACAWVINKPMLDLIIDVFNNKGMKELDIPPPVSECPPMPKISQNMTTQEKSKVFRERLRLRQQKSEMYSLWCQELYRLSIANKFRDEIFWFPHNLDFRGRTYPYPPHFNHLGSDVARSILVFAKGKPLGEKGLDWLKIHLINLTGFKKRSSNADRLKYANEMMSDILDSADNPLNGKKWWQSSDEPWQTLACCKEIANAVRSTDVEQYVSHFPVHQDGSCNGLQHYAALGRDQSGAESVNLHPFNKPQDVYSDIAELVEKARVQDEENGVEIATVLKGFVRRKVIKQTVMTTVYGVTKYGAKLQILRQLKDIPEFPQKHVWAASVYLTHQTFQCLMEMFSATKEIQDWLTTCAHLISTVCHKPVEWVTPLGLPVIQPYHRAVHFNKYGIQLFDAWSQFEKPNSMKQKNAFPPNFIHSLDSTHMMLTSLYCLQAGITFVSVHDCYWTHGCDVPVMNRICREQFVSLHKQPIIEDLSDFLVEKFANDVPSFSKAQEKIDKEKSQTLLNSVLRKVPEKVLTS
ncbi:DNA-directed RNA polymerase, mitochondrial-like isoform X2 [Gigantopelta aegis]|uniref:DNA-directed RNA polymerase, mitochondrial-like isoform X2 n=1 Tax=Gigantopelta aegis TaxID=1735272 RepID=UPI001B88B8DE|nr:DNA-directed RNA polymerase, mitochondrial-like isoform X2 [Gigantopelta aegis]